MRKLLMLVLLVTIQTVAYSQMITASDVDEAIEELYGSQPQTGKEYMQLADRLMLEYPLDQNQQLSFTSVLEAPGKSKDELFVLLNNWFVSSFNSGKETIQMVDKEQGVVLAKGYLSGVGSRVGFSKSVNVCEYIIVRLDIKDEKARLITSIQEYYMETSSGVGQILFGGAAMPDVQIPVYQCYPFNKQMYKSYKREASIGYVGGVVYSKILANKIERAINYSLTGTESQDW